MGKRNYSIELLRFVFALIIVCFHFYNVNTPQPDFFFAHGATGVEFFFLVSGYLMTATAFRTSSSPISIGKSSIHFLKKKIKAFIVPVYCSWFITFIIAHCMASDVTLEIILTDFFNSIFELLFLRNAGFTGYYCINQIWYISAILLTMSVCYPLLLKLKETYLYCLAPIIAIFILGFLSHQYTSIVNISEFTGIIYKCQLRSFGMINLGVVCYALAEELKKVKLTKAGIVTLSLVEICIYTVSIRYMILPGLKNQDYLIALLLAIAVIISFSQVTWLRLLSDYFSPICSKLGYFSLYLYLAHVAICKNIVPLLEKQFSSRKIVFIIGMTMIFILSFIIMFLTCLVRKRVLPWLKQLLTIPPSSIF